VIGPHQSREPTMGPWPICNMLWRIGDILPVMKQLDWCRREGFDGVGVHAGPGTPGAWQGIDPLAADGAMRRTLCRAISGFSLCEVHAPFAIELAGDSLAEGIHQLEPITALAHDIGARIVTVHAQSPTLEWAESMAALDADARGKGLEIGLEIVSGFCAVQSWALPGIGITLDVGHLYGMDAGRHLAPFGTIGALVRELGPRLLHLHVHDVATLDHVEIGTGCVDFVDLLTGLRDISYARGMCLEMNPDRVSPDGIRRSLASLRSISEKLGPL
jgi:sugar phosphate isomerase/epimerase